MGVSVMPSIQDWLNGLTRSRRVYVDSSDKVAQSVNGRAQSRSFNGTPKIAQGLSLFSPTKEIDITPAELLYCIGRVTTPRASNLSDLCSTWASIRYVWAFEPDTRVTDLCLSNIARDIDFHQKGVFSDEAGVGMAAFIIEKYFHGYNPIDVTLAIRKQEVLGLRNQYANISRLSV